MAAREQLRLRLQDRPCIRHSPTRSKPARRSHRDTHTTQVAPRDEIEHRAEDHHDHSSTDDMEGQAGARHPVSKPPPPRHRSPNSPQASTRSHECACGGLSAPEDHAFRTACTMGRPRRSCAGSRHSQDPGTRPPSRRKQCGVAGTNREVTCGVIALLKGKESLGIAKTPVFTNTTHPPRKFRPRSPAAFSEPGSVGAPRRHPSAGNSSQ